MTREEIDSIVCQILTVDGPDGHTDGHDVLTDFIVALQQGKEQEWKKKYEAEQSVTLNN